MLKEIEAETWMVSSSMVVTVPSWFVKAHSLQPKQRLKIYVEVAE